MPLNEKFGKLVLLEKLSDGPLGATYRAARVKSSGLDRIVTLLRYSEAISAHPDAAPRLMDQARAASRLPVPGLARVVGIGRVEESYYCSYEFVEGRSLRAVIDRASEDRFPFAAENALMVASRASAVLERLHGRKDENGATRIHGLLQPSELVVSWEGDVQLTGLGAWPSLRGTGLLGPAGGRYLAPEQAAGDPGDPRSDVYSLGLVLLEALTHRAPDGSDPFEGLDTARFVTITGEEEPLPDPLEEVLRRALATQPSSRYESMGQMRQAVDTLLFSGDFTPTTFNLAYFMHTLFRQDMEHEAAALEEARRADYTEFLPPPSAEPAVTAPAGAAGAPVEETSSPDSSETLPPAAAPSFSGANGAPGRDTPGASRSGRRVRSRVSAEGSGRMFARAESSRPGQRGLALVGGLLLAVLLGGGAGYVYFVKLRPLSAVTSAATLSPDAVAALARVRELEAQLAALQQEKALAEAELQAREAEASPSPSPAADTREAEAEAAAARARRRAAAREEARRQAQAEQAAREAEIRRLEEEMRAAETVLVAEQRRVPSGGVTGALPAVLPPPPTPVPTPPPVVPGQLVSIDDPEVSAPELLSQEPVRYPQAARLKERESLVLVEALVGQDGAVLEARVLEASVGGFGFEKAAIEKVRKNRYRPATKRGVPVRVRVRVPVRFRME